MQLDIGLTLWVTKMECVIIQEENGDDVRKKTEKGFPINGYET